MSLMAGRGFFTFLTPIFNRAPVLWRPRTGRGFPGYIQPCQPMPTPQPPRGGDWLHEIKHDGYHMIVRRDAAGVRLFIRPAG